MTNEPTRERLERALGVLKSGRIYTFYEAMRTQNGVIRGIVQHLQRQVVEVV